MAGKRTTLDGVKQVIAVASGKGGVGKSTVSVNLALALAGLGYRVGLFDGDIHGPNVPLMLGVRRRGRATGEEAQVAVAVAQEYEKTLPKSAALERYGLKIMSVGLLVGEDQPVIPDTNLVGRMVMQLIRSVDWGELDFLLIDLPPGTGEPQITLSQHLQIDGVVLVSTPPDVALLDTTKALNLYRDRRIGILGLIENMSYYICPNCGDQREIFPRSQREAERAVRADDVPLLGRIPLSPAVGTAGDSGRPLVITEPQSAVTQAFLEAARRVVEQIAQLAVTASEPEEPTEQTPPLQTSPSQPQSATEKPAPATPARAANVLSFQSSYLAELAKKLLDTTKEKLGEEAGQLKRDEPGMRRVVEIYRAAWEEISGGTLPGPLQKELLTYVMSQILPE
jgi:ATP-binding protein involved in chromosome partitioning